MCAADIDADIDADTCDVHHKAAQDAQHTHRSELADTTDLTAS